jgi:NADPH-dependent glutamate synthase beta subunit-like oxidoreductase
MTERCLIPIATFEAADSMVIDDLAKLIREADERARQAQAAEEAQPKRPAETPTRRRVALIGAKAAGWF